VQSSIDQESQDGLEEFRQIVCDLQDVEIVMEDPPQDSLNNEVVEEVLA
jgi:hypothetical protein